MILDTTGTELASSVTNSAQFVPKSPATIKKELDIVEMEDESAELCGIFRVYYVWDSAS